MLYRTDIARRALFNLGSTLSITDIATDSSTQARIIRQIYPQSMSEMLQSHPWKFATGYANLVKVEDSPASGWSFAYAFPVDALIIRQVAPREMPFPKINLYQDQKIQFEELMVGGAMQIHCNFADAKAEFTQNVHPEFAVPTHFAIALAAKLALDIAPSIITNNFAQVANTLTSRLTNVISEQKALDESRTTQQLDAESPFERARR